MQISPYQFDSQDVRIVQDDESGELLFVASDVCRALGITKPENAYSRLDPVRDKPRRSGRGRIARTLQASFVGRLHLFEGLFPLETPYH